VIVDVLTRKLLDKAFEEQWSYIRMQNLLCMKGVGKKDRKYHWQQEEVAVHEDLQEVLQK
jgi:hypothetical protein